ncbi:MAG: hypothetical protein ABL949_11245 [Fimbriimonadaceae bacterium]
MNRPSKKEIKAAVDKLKENSNSATRLNEPAIGKLSEKKSSQRIRKQGV